MRKSLKRAALIAATGAMLIGSAFSAQAASAYNGQWCQESNGGWWYKLTEDGKTFLANTWYWIKDEDGVVRCYYFDYNGWLQTGKTIDGETVDANGRWVKNGKVQEGDASKEYATSIDFAKLHKTTTSSTNKTTTSTAGLKKNGGKKTYKSSGKGDNPKSAAATQGYTNSTVTGSTITNSWANFQFTLSGATPKVDTTGSGTDIYTDSDTTSDLFITYYPMDKYTAGNTNIDTFITGFLADARGYKGGAKAADIQLGAYTFKQLTKTVNTPEGKMYDNAYIRAIDGTNYAMVITVEKNGNSQDYLSSLKTMAKVR